MNKLNVKNTIKVICIVGIGIIVYFCYKQGIFENTNVEGIQEYVLSYGPLAPLVYTMMFTLSALTLFPDSVLAVSGGVIFGLFYGTLYTIIGAILAATFSFFISRFLGQSILENFLKNKKVGVINAVEKKGFISILLLRLIPIIPFDVISYGAGLTKISYIDFLGATALGIIPGVLIYINIGNQAGNSNFPEFLKAIAMLFLLICVSYIAKKKGVFNKIIGASESTETFEK